MTDTLSPLAVVVLSLFSEGPAHTYELLKTLKARQPKWRVQVNAGAAYRAVERLAADGLIVEEGTAREGNRPERTVYRISEAGKEALTKNALSLMESDKRPFESFRLGLTFIDDLEVSTALAVLRQRLERLEKQMADGTAAVSSLAAAGLGRRFMLVYELDNARTAAEIAWLRQILHDTETGELDWYEPAPAEPIDIETAMRNAQ